MKETIKTILDFARVEEIIQYGDANKLLAIVMRLTKGTANPNTVMDAIKEIKSGN